MTETTPPVGWRISHAGIQAALAQVRAGLVHEVVLVDPMVPGLRLRVTPGHGKGPTAVWRLAKRIRGKQTTISFAGYPARSITEARDKARQLDHDIRFEAHDPIAARRLDKTAGSALTMAGLLDRYAKDSPPASWPSQMRPGIERLFGVFLTRPVSEITAPQLQAAVDDYTAKSARRLYLSFAQTVFKWAAEPARALVPAAWLFVRTKVAKPQRDRWLFPHEMKALLQVLTDGASGVASANPFIIGHHIVLLTLARRGELEQARWRDLDLAAGLWVLPKTKTTPHQIPLSRQAVALFARLRPANADPVGYVLPHDCDQGAAWTAATKALQMASDTTAAPWARHDLRRSSLTYLGKLRVPKEVQDAAANHVQRQRGITGIYDRSDLTEQTAEALQRLADLYDSLLTGGGEVRRLRLA